MEFLRLISIVVDHDRFVNVGVLVNDVKGDNFIAETDHIAII
jgi:hypothetical protein